MPYLRWRMSAVEAVIACVLLPWAAAGIMVAAFHRPDEREPFNAPSS